MGIFDCHMHTLELSPHRDSVCSFLYMFQDNSKEQVNSSSTGGGHVAIEDVYLAGACFCSWECAYNFDIVFVFTWGGSWGCLVKFPIVNCQSLQG